MRHNRHIWLLVLWIGNFFSFAITQAQQLEWIHQEAIGGSEFNAGVTVDPAGNVYIAGTTYFSVSGPSGGDSDAIVSKYDSYGNLQWTRQTGTSTYDACTGVSADAQGNVYISGYTVVSASEPGAGTTYSEDIFLSKFTTSGILEWTRQIGSTSDEWSTGVFADVLGNVYVSGYTRGSLAGQSAGLGDAFVIKYDLSGNLQWARQLGTATWDSSYGVSADSLGNVYIAGTTEGNLNGPNAGGNDVFLSKFDPAGNLQWNRQWGTAGNDVGHSISVDSAGNLYISGNTSGSLGGPNAGDDDVFISKCDPAGNLLWIRQIGTNANEWSTSVSADSLGNVYISGNTFGSLAGPLVGSADGFVSKYDALGNPQWIRQIGTVDVDYSYGVAADVIGNSYVSGYTSGSLGAPNAGGYDAFVAKFSTIPEPGTLLLATFASVALLLPRARRQTERTLISTNPR